MSKTTTFLYIGRRLSGLSRVVIGGHRRRCSIGSYSLSPEFALLIVTGDRRVAGGAGRTDSAAPRPGYETGLMQERDGNSRPEVLVSVSAPASALPGITMRLVPEGLARAGIASQFERSGRPSSARSGLRSLPTPARPRAAHS